MKLRLATLAVAALLVALGLIWLRDMGTSRHAPAPRPAASREAAPLPQPPQAAWVAAAGRVEPRSGVRRLGFPVAGRIGEVLVKTGDAVQQGQILARLEGDVPTAQTTLTSPIDGVVLSVFRQAGEIVSPARDTPVMSVGDLDRLRVRAAIHEHDIAAVTVGQKVYCLSEASGSRKYTGTVSALGKSLVDQDGTPVLDALIDLNGAPQLPVGLRLDVFILTGLSPTQNPPAAAP